MKTMTCKQLGGACNLEFHANTFDELADTAKIHGMEMFQKNDKEHLQAMEKMSGLMQNPDAIMQWFADKKKEFDALPVD